MLAFDSNLVPIVGQQITLTSGNSATVLPQILLLRQRAAAAECDVVVKGNIGGLQRGWVCTGTSCCSGSNCSGSSTFQSDRTGETETASSLAAKAGVAGQELTYTAVPPGSGNRIGIDRDRTASDQRRDGRDADPDRDATPWRDDEHHDHHRGDTDHVDHHSRRWTEQIPGRSSGRGQEDS